MNLTTEPIPVRVTRYRCPCCARSHSTKSRARQHISRCWFNPEARGCKTCKHFEPYFYEDGSDRCRQDVDLAGRPACERCDGGGEIFVGLDDPFGGTATECPECAGDGAQVKPGPIIHCESWEEDTDA